MLTLSALHGDYPEDAMDEEPRRTWSQQAVDEADEESFPASDPPAWTPTHSGAPLRRRDRSASSPPSDADTGS